MRHQRAVLVALLSAVVAVTAACDSTPPRGPGSILITAASASAEPGVVPMYQIRVDAGSPRASSLFETVSYVVNGLAHGDHVVSLEGLAASCTAEGNPRTVRLRGDDTALVVFTIACQRITGDIRVNVSTTGPDPDPGYRVTFNGMAGPFVGGNGSLTMSFVPAGNHTLALSDVASNCTASGPQSVSVTPGVTTIVNFTVACNAVAVVRVLGGTTGPDRDADGIVFALDQVPVARAGTGTTYIRVGAGTHAWALRDVQPNCAVGGPVSGSLTIAPGDTVTINAAMTCTAIGYGVAGTIVTDGPADTLANVSGNVNAAHDILQLTTRYATDWLILVLRLARPAGSVGVGSPAGVLGTIDMDTDETIATGIPPLASSFGGSSQLGADYSVWLFDVTADGVRVRRNAMLDTTVHRVPIAIEGDSVIIRIPLAKLGGDDGNMTLTTIVGTFDRPTDIAPNTGVIVARPATAPATAAVRKDAPGAAQHGRALRSEAWPPRE